MELKPELGTQGGGSLVMAAWHSSPVVVLLRDLSWDAALHDLGGLESLDPERLLASGPLTPFTASKFAREADFVLRNILEKPTFAGLFELVGMRDLLPKMDDAIAGIKAEVATLPRGAERKNLEFELSKALANFLGMLPFDFIAPLITYAAGTHRKSIRALTDAALLAAARSAAASGGEPFNQFPAHPLTATVRAEVNDRARLLLSAALAEGEGETP